MKSTLMSISAEKCILIIRGNRDNEYKKKTCGPCEISYNRWNEKTFEFYFIIDRQGILAMRI